MALIFDLYADRVFDGAAVMADLRAPYLIVFKM